MSQRVEFDGFGGRRLVGRLDVPAGGATAFAIFAHCFTCGKDIAAAARIARGLAQSGIAVLRYDVAGLGESPGNFADATFSCDVQDLEAAAAYLRANYRAPTLLIGHSLGGAAVLAVTSRIPEVRAAVTIGAPSDPAHVLGLFTDTVATGGDVHLRLADRDFTLRRAFLDDIAEQPQLERIKTLGAALLVMHSPTDEIVGIDSARIIYETARHSKSFIALDGADHLLTGRGDIGYVVDVIVAWSKRYLANVADGAETLPAGTVVVTSTTAKFTQVARTSGHTFNVDEPLHVGGDGSAPGPYDLLLAGLGACTSMTMRLYADRKGFDLGEVTVTLSHDRIHAEDCETCESQTGHVDRIQRSITVSGDLSSEQLASLMMIADRCPVHRTLTNEVTIPTTLVRG